MRQVQSSFRWLRAQEAQRKQARSAEAPASSDDSELSLPPALSHRARPAGGLFDGFDLPPSMPADAAGAPGTQRIIVQL